MRNKMTAVALILCVMCGTTLVGCGESMQIRAAISLYEFVTGLAYEWVLNTIAPPQPTVIVVSENPQQ